MILRLASFGPFDTAILPAGGLWTAASGVTIVDGGGRSGEADDNCAAFDTALGSVLSLTVAPGNVSNLYIATYGVAVRILTLTDTVTIGSIWTALSHFDLIVSATGRIQLVQVVGGVSIGTICETADDIIPIGTGGIYIECQITFQADLATAAQIRVSDQWGDMTLVAQGALLAFVAGEVPYTTFRLGGGVGEAPATWQACDVYLNDGVPAPSAIFYRGQLLYNDSYFGNTHIDAFYPTADGTNLSTGNTPWVPDTGTVQYSRINEHPPDEDASYLEADTADQTSTFAFQSPRARPFGRLNCSADTPIYGVQWDGRLRHTGTPGDIVAIVREIVGGTIATDDVAQGEVQTVDSEDYAYYPDVFDRNPLDDTPWTFGVFFPTSVGAEGTTEFGVRLV